MVPSLIRTRSSADPTTRLRPALGWRGGAGPVGFVLALAAGVAPLPATLTWAVNSPIDGPDAVLDGICETAPGNGVCTLRAAVTEANYLGQFTDTLITIPPMIIQLSLGDVIVQPTSTYPMVIQGAGMTASVIQKLFGAPPQRFATHWTGRLELRGLQISGFSSPDDSGGAIASYGHLLVDHCLVVGNSARIGGAIAATGGSLLVSESLFQNNSASTLDGGAIDAEAGSSLLVSDSLFENNSAGGDGGAILATGATRIAGGTFRGNSAADGGALFLRDSGAAIVNSTLVENTALANGGAIVVERNFYPTARVDLFNSTLTGNRADTDLDGTGEGGAIYSNITAGADSAITASNSILAGNIGSIEILPWGNHIAWPQECYGLFLSNGYNIVQANDEGLCTISGATISADPDLDPLAWNGGFTATRALGPGSPALGAGRPPAAGGCDDETGLPLATDQRGAARPVGGNCDLGSFEWGPLIFSDDFELGSDTRWSAVAP